MSILLHQVSIPQKWAEFAGGYVRILDYISAGTSDSTILDFGSFMNRPGLTHAWLVATTELHGQQ